jgi:phage-related minor tail protein
VLTTAKTLGENAVAAAGLTDVTQASSLAQTVAINANNKAIQDNVKQALDLANATYQETGSIDTASASLAANRQHLIDTMVQHGYSEEAARLYIDRLGLTPANINTQVNLDANQAKGDLQFIDGKYQVVRNGVTGSVNVDISPAVQNLERLGLKLTDLEKRVIAIDMTDEDRRLAARAGGGPVYGGSAYIVGENGPEIFLPGRSGYIVPNRATAGVSAAAATGDTYNVTVVSTGLGADSPQIQRDVVAALRGYEKRNGPVTVGAG